MQIRFCICEKIKKPKAFITLGFVVVRDFNFFKNILARSPARTLSFSSL
jgi:hypothetical protein